MRIATYQRGKEARLGFVVEDRIVDLAAVAQRKKMKAADDMLGLIAEMPAITLRTLWREAEAWVSAGRPSVPISRAKLLAPIQRPRKNIMCMGRNYIEHARETGGAPPDVPVFFTKPPTCVIGPGAPVTYHTATQALDYEVELAVVFGRRGRDIPAAKALDYVFGYTIMNDITARDLQRRHQQWFKGKSLDTFAPLGPWIVHRSAVPDPQRLRLRMRVNGEVRQNTTTASMIFSVAQLVESLSAGMTIEPGDIMATGTPEGVGMGFNPPKWLHVGDIVEADVEGIGLLRNHIAAPK